MHIASKLVVALPLLVAGCQSYDWVYQPDADREGTHLVFKVDQPSKADILFVIDNSSSMLSKQQALADSINVLLDALAPQDTRYRIGITSTDSIGFDTDCDGVKLPVPYSPGAKGNCIPGNHAQLRRAHDGALGRLLASYDPDVFRTDAPFVNAILSEIAGRGVSLDPDILTKLGYLMPASLTDPDQFKDKTLFPGFTGDKGARWVIDRETLQLESCQVCQCTKVDDKNRVVCDQDNPSYLTCADPIAQIMVQAYFRANISALGNRGQGWEEGLRSSQLAVGIDPRDEGPTALTPANDLTRVGDVPEHDGANTFLARVEATGQGERASWLRDEALLAIMYVSDEEDCSMPDDMWKNHCAYETGCGDSWVQPPDWFPNPDGSMCYQEEAQAKMLATSRMSQLLTTKKGSASRVAVGVIAGVKQTGQQPGLEDRQAVSSDCAATDAGPTDQCSCLVGVDLAEPDCGLWCLYTANKNGSCTADNTFCDGMAGKRYVAFANSFSRRTFETICLSGEDGFGKSMAKFAKIATLACFELANVWPAGTPPQESLITVKRASKAEAEQGIAPSILPKQEIGSTEAGWYYDGVENKVCLTGLDRLIGDVYDIFILHKDKLDFNK